LLCSSHFDEMTPSDIAVEISKVMRSNKLPGGFSHREKDRLEKRLEFYGELEREYRMFTGASYAYSPEIAEIVHEWCHASDEGECKEVLRDAPILMGDFVKVVLEINGVVEEWMGILQDIGNEKLCHRVSAIPNLLLKYIATPQSIYV